MKKTVKVSAVQTDIKGMAGEANLAHMCELIDKTVTEHGAELIVFPELANSGFIKNGDLKFKKEYFRYAERIPGSFTKGLSERAKKYGVYIVTGMLEAHPQVPYTMYNSAILIGPTGEVIGVHRKVHPCSEERAFFYAGDRFNVFSTELGNIAIQVCADGSFPELSRIFTLKGAEIICTVYNVPVMAGKDFINERILHIAACRAIENLNFYIGCNRVGSDASGSFVGHSCIAGPWGQILAYSDSDREEFLTATLEEEMILEARGELSYFHDRKPGLYTVLSEPL